MRLPCATCRRRRLARFGATSPAEAAEVPGAAADRRARSCATRSSWSVFAAAGVSNGSPVGSVEVGSVIVLTTLVLVFFVVFFFFVFFVFFVVIVFFVFFVVIVILVIVAVARGRSGVARR